MLVRVAILVLIVFVGIIPASAEEIEIPEWVKTTLVMWSEGEISDQEFVTAIDYLKDKGIVKLSSVNDEEIQRQIEYLKAKNEVIKKEVKILRETNKQFANQISSCMNSDQIANNKVS